MGSRGSRRLRPGRGQRQDGVHRATVACSPEPIVACTETSRVRLGTNAVVRCAATGWGTTGLGYNVTKAKEILGSDAAPGWDAIFNPEIAKKFGECGIYVLDTADEVIPAFHRRAA